MNTLKIEGLTKTYRGGVRSLDNINLQLTNGLFGLLGPNGAGKSSLMRTIATLQQPDKGEITMNGVNIGADTRFLRSQLGYLPQEFGVYPHMSAIELLNHLAVLKGILDKQRRRKQIESLLDLTNLTGAANRPVHNYSGGMKQRFGIAQALLGDPQLIIVDEPTAGLDPEERNRFNNLLSTVSTERIVILSTHLVADVEDLCTSMAIMSNGRLLCMGDPRLLIHHLQGKMWGRIIKHNEIEGFTAIYKIISKRLVAGMVHIHVFSEEPLADFQRVEPSLEDFYFLTLSQQN